MTKQTRYVDVGLMLVQYRINVLCLLGNDTFQKQSRDVDPMSVHCWADVGNGGPKVSHHWIDVSLILECLRPIIDTW